jgi:hypothetical protein
VNYDLSAANGTTIHTYGWLPLSLNFGLRRDFTWCFIMADITRQTSDTFLDRTTSPMPSHVEFVTAPPSYYTLAASQDGNDELRTLLGSTTTLRLEKLSLPGTMVSIYCDTSARRPRSYVPAPLQLQVFQSVHDLLHPGTKETAKLAVQRFVWPGV